MLYNNNALVLFYELNIVTIYFSRTKKDIILEDIWLSESIKRYCDQLHHFPFLKIYLHALLDERFRPTSSPCQNIYNIKCHNLIIFYN